MGEVWENARRRGDGNDYAIFALAERGTIRHLEVDTGCYVGNAPGWMRVSVADLADGTAEGALETATWTDVLAKVAVQPDTRHRLLSDEQLRLARRRYDESRAS